MAEWQSAIQYQVVFSVSVWTFFQDQMNTKVLLSALLISSQADCIVARVFVGMWGREVLIA